MSFKKTWISGGSTNGLNPDKGEVGGSSPPRPTIQITSKYEAIHTFPPTVELLHKTNLPTICQLSNSQIPAPAVYTRASLGLGRFSQSGMRPKLPRTRASRDFYECRLLKSITFGAPSFAQNRVRRYESNQKQFPTTGLRTKPQRKTRKLWPNRKRYGVTQDLSVA
jgi:hypothetical protein